MGDCFFLGTGRDGLLADEDEEGLFALLPEDEDGLFALLPEDGLLCVEEELPVEEAVRFAEAPASRRFASEDCPAAPARSSRIFLIRSFASSRIEG